MVQKSGLLWISGIMRQTFEGLENFFGSANCHCPSTFWAFPKLEGEILPKIPQSNPCKVFPSSFVNLSETPFFFRICLKKALPNPPQTTRFLGIQELKKGQVGAWWKLQLVMSVNPKIMGIYPPNSIHFFIGFGTIIFTIHFGVSLFLEDHPRYRKWLITMVIVSPLRIGLWDPFQMAFSWLINEGY